MVDIKVCGLSEVEDILRDWKPDRVVSLVDPFLNLPETHTWHDVIWCEDVEVFYDPWAAKYDDISFGLDFCIPYQKILIHCQGGISRSPAFAIGALVKQGMSIQEACDYVHAQRPNMAPNKLILQHCEKYLQLDGLLVNQVQTIVSRYPKGLVLWCDRCQKHFQDGENCPGGHFLEVAPDENVYV